MAQTVKNLPAVQKTQIYSLGQEEALKKEMATHSSILAWRIPWTEEPDGLQSMGCKQSDMTEQLTLSLSIYIYSFPDFFSLIGYYRILSRVPYDTGIQGHSRSLLVTYFIPSVYMLIPHF